MSTSNDEQHHVLFRRLLAGAGAGIVSKTAVAPLDRVKILMQIQTMHLKTGVSHADSKLFTRAYVGIGSSLCRIYRDEGVLGLWKGNGANVIRTIPNFAVKFAANDFFKDFLKANTIESEHTQKHVFQNGIIAGCGAGFLQIISTYPLETVRTRLSMSAVLLTNTNTTQQSSNSSYARQNQVYSGILGTGNKIIQSEGISGLYKGLGPTLVAGVPYVALQLATYDWLKSYMNNLMSNFSGAENFSILLTVTSGALAGVVANTLTFPGDVVRSTFMLEIEF
jgi:hypothetical protein